MKQRSFKTFSLNKSLKHLVLNKALKTFSLNNRCFTYSEPEMCNLTRLRLRNRLKFFFGTTIVIVTEYGK